MVSEPGPGRDREVLLLEDSVRWPKINGVQVTHSQLWPWMPVGYLNACGLHRHLWVTWTHVGYTDTCGLPGHLWVTWHV